jgi:hypothetical protein
MEQEGQSQPSSGPETGKPRCSRGKSLRLRPDGTVRAGCGRLVCGGSQFVWQFLLRRAGEWA